MAYQIMGGDPVTGELPPVVETRIDGKVAGGAGTVFAGTDLATADLNTITTPGVYRQATAATATTARNYPTASHAWSVRVYPVASGVLMQEATPVTGTAAGRVTYTRTLAASTWSVWRATPSQRVDNTAGRAIYTWDDTANREQLIYGDTGLRRIDSLLTNGWTATAAATYGPWVRRNGNIVTLSGYLSWGGRTGTAFLTLPLGYRPERITFGHIDTTTAEQGALVNVATNGVLDAAYISTVTVGTSGFLSATFTTSDPWPTTLPGTPFGTIPNL